MNQENIIRYKVSTRISLNINDVIYSMRNDFLHEPNVLQSEANFPYDPRLIG
jgi:hypothetical protein